MNRRQLIGGSALAALVAVFGGLVYRIVRPQHGPDLEPFAADKIEEFVTRQLSYLKLAPGAAAEFARDFAPDFMARAQERAKPTGSFAAWFHSSSRFFRPSGRRADLLSALDDPEFGGLLGLRFLESSTYFFTGEDETQVVEYRRVDAIYRPCVNPFAEFGLEEAG